MADSSPGIKGMATPEQLRKSMDASSPGTDGKLEALAHELDKLRSAGDGESLDQTIAAVQAELSTMRGENEELRGYAEQALEQAERLKQENEELRKEKEDAVLERQLAKKSSETERLAEASGAYKRNLLQQNLARKETEVQQANDRLQAAERQIKGLSSQLSELRKAHREAISELEVFKERQSVNSEAPAESIRQTPSAEVASDSEPTADKGNEHAQLAARLMERGPENLDSATLAAVAAGLRDTSVLEKQLKRTRDENERLQKEIKGLNETVFSKSFKAPSAWAEREVKYKMEKRAWEVEIAQLKEQIRGLSEENTRYREDNKAAEFETQIQELKQAVKQAQGERTEAQKALHELQLEMREAAVRHSATGHWEQDPEADNVHSIINSMEHNHIGVQQPQQSHKAQKAKGSNARGPAGEIVRSGSAGDVESFPVGAANMQEIIEDYDDQRIGMRGPDGRKKSQRQRPAHFSGFADAASGDLSDGNVSSVDLESIKGELQAEARGRRQSEGRRRPQPSPLGTRHSQEWETGSETDSLSSDRLRHASSAHLLTTSSGAHPADLPAKSHGTHPADLPATSSGTHTADSAPHADSSRLSLPSTSAPGHEKRGAAESRTAVPARGASDVTGAEGSRGQVGAQHPADVLDTASYPQPVSRHGQAQNPIGQLRGDPGDAALIGDATESSTAQDGAQNGISSAEAGGQLVAGDRTGGGDSRSHGDASSGGIAHSQGLQEGEPHPSFSSWEHGRDALSGTFNFPASSAHSQGGNETSSGATEDARQQVGGMPGDFGARQGIEEGGPREGSVAAAVTSRGDGPSLPAVHLVARDWTSADNTRDPSLPLEAVEEPALTTVSNAIINERYIPLADPDSRPPSSQQTPADTLSSANSDQTPVDSANDGGAEFGALQPPLPNGSTEADKDPASSHLGSDAIVNGSEDESAQQADEAASEIAAGEILSEGDMGTVSGSGRVIVSPSNADSPQQASEAASEAAPGEEPPEGDVSGDAGTASSAGRLIGPESEGRPRGLVISRPPTPVTGNLAEIEPLGDADAETQAPRLSVTSTGDESLDLGFRPLRAPAVETSRSTLKDASGRYISRASSEEDSPWTDEKRKSLQEFKEAVEAEWREHQADQDVGALRYRAAELESRVEMQEAQILKMQRALERADQGKARLEQELLDSLSSHPPGSAASAAAQQKGLGSMRMRMRRVMTLSQKPISRQKLETEGALQEAYRETQVLQRQRDELHRQLSNIATKLNAGLIPDSADLALPAQEEEGFEADSVAEESAEADAEVQPDGDSNVVSEGRVGLNLKVTGEAAQKRRVAAFFGGLTDEEVEVMSLREENTAMMETLVRTKVELAETQGDYLKMRRALIRAVEKQAALAEKLDSVQSAFGEGDMASLGDLIKGPISPRNFGGDIESLGERRLY